jgi:hypothetical protein
LANAIRKGYGPPSGFEAAKKGKTPKRSKRQRDEQTREKESRQMEHKERILKQKYAEMEARDPAAISEFFDDCRIRADKSGKNRGSAIAPAPERYFVRLVK